MLTLIMHSCIIIDADVLKSIENTHILQTENVFYTPG